MLEFALALPFLLVFVIGIEDFGSAYTFRQKLANAAREGARYASSLSCADCGNTSPSTTTAIRDVVANYLSGAGLTSCAVGTSAASAGTYAWTYGSSSSGCGNFQLKIERSYTFLQGSVTVVASRVTLTYPFTWHFGSIIGLLVKGANPTLPSTITTNAIMQNLP